jgi:hypothetical protein
LGIGDFGLSELARRFRGLKVQIVLWIVLPLSLVLIGVAFTGVYSHEQAMRDLVQERDRALAVVSASQVRELLQERLSALAVLAAEPPFHHDQLPEQRALLAEAGDMAGLFADGVVLLDPGGDLLDASADDELGSLARRGQAPDALINEALGDAHGPG